MGGSFVKVQQGWLYTLDIDPVASVVVCSGLHDNPWRLFASSTACESVRPIKQELSYVRFCWPGFMCLHFLHSKLYRKERVNLRKDVHFGLKSYHICLD
jgi:hypothetical protein